MQTRPPGIFSIRYPLGSPAGFPTVATNKHIIKMKMMNAQGNENNFFEYFYHSEIILRQFAIYSNTARKKAIPLNQLRHALASSIGAVAVEVD
jgi:hypothetical protein